MKTRILLLASLWGSIAMAADYTLDFSGATLQEAEAPVLRRAEMAVAVGSVPAVAVGDMLNLKLFGDVDFALRIVSAPSAGIAGQSLIARDEKGGASAIVKVTATTARISVDDFMNRRQYTVRCKDGKVMIVERDNSQVEEGECGTCASPIETPEPVTEATATLKSASKSRALLGSANAFDVASHKSVVDILVAFDKGAKAWAEDGSNWGNGGDSIEEFADYAVNKMNMVLLNSQLDDQFCYRLVGVTEIDDSWTAIDNTLLNNVRVRAGKLAKLGQLREKYGADTITLLIDRTNGTTSGIGYEYASKYTDTSGFDGMNYACNVCDINTVYSRYTMSHETGHNMGCGHSNRQGSNSGPGRYSYSCGYHFTDANNVKRGTVMAYTYSGDNDGWYDPTPYFSTPDISPSEYGCALGEAGINDNRQTLKNTHADIASLREHVLPYDWDVKFLDDNGNEIKDGNYFSSSINVTLAHNDSNATIYYTTDGTEPDGNSNTCKPGDKIYLSTFYDGVEKKISACAVVNGQAVSKRSITLTSGIYWSGEEGENGSGRWMANDSGIKAWCNSSSYVLNSDKVAFLDLPGVDVATVTVKGQVSPASAVLFANSTEYKFVKGDDNAVIKLHDEAFEPAGDWNFNVPLSLDAKTFKVSAHRLVEFHEPFGTNILAGATFGYCTNNISLGNFGTLIVSPGQGKTQKFDKFDTQNYYSSSRIIFGEGNIIINGPYDTDKGVFGNVQVIVGSGANLEFNCPAATGHAMTSPFTVEKNATVSFNGNMEHMRRPFYLNGGTIIAKSRFDRMHGALFSVSDDSVLDGTGHMLIRFADEPIDVAEGKTLTLNIPTQDGSNTTGWGIIKKGGGTLVANKELKHSGKTIVSNGTFTVGYSSSQAFGGGWELSNGANLTVKEGCGLLIPSLSMESGAELTLPIAESAPLTVNDTLNLAGVNLQLIGDDNYVGGDRFTVVAADGGIDNADSLNVIDMPTLAEGLKWEFETSEKSIVAFVKDYGTLEKELPLVSNNSSIAITFPNDAELGNNGGVVIGSKPLLIDGISTKAVSITLDVEIPEDELDAEATICSWKVGTAIARCVRRPDQELSNTLDCYHGDGTGHVDNSADGAALKAGRHMIKIAYYSYDDNTYGGTFVYVDGQLAYRGAGLRWSKDSVNRITVGATAHDSAKHVYNGLTIHGVAVIDAMSTLPIRGMTTSGGEITYDYMARGYPSVFANTPNGSFMLNDSILRGALGSEQYDSASVSAFAAFPTDATGVVFGLCLIDDFNQLTTIQAEYIGNGKFMLRSNDSEYTTDSVSFDIDVSVPHLYTIAYDGSTIKLCVDGSLLLESNDFWGMVCNEIDFGCGYWNEWSGNGKDSPNPMPDFRVYASHIALGASNRAVSEAAVAASIATEEDCPEPPETPAVVDVLVAYDKGAQAYLGSRSLEEFAQTQIGKMNDVLVTNKLDRFYSYRLAGVCKVDGVYDNIDTAPGLIADGTGAAVSLRAARELYGADTVTLLVDVTGNTLGNSSPLNSPDNVANQHECAFSVCSISAVDTGKQHTMIHENAHNMGCGHARAQNIINSPFEYGRGYYFKDGDVSRHTIMAYGGDNDASWYFSTASREFGYDLGNTTNNNARVLKETCSEVAKWREGSAISLEDVEVPGAVLETSARFPWYVDDEGLVRSYNQTDYTYQCTTPLKATVVGPKVLSFKHKSYFLGEDLGSNYSHIEVLLDDSAVLSSKHCNTEWSDDVKVYIPAGKHTVQFVYSQRDAMNNPKANKDNYPATMDDALWLKDIALSEVPESLFWSSTSEDVSWLMPGYSTVGDEHLDSVAINDLGIVNYLDFGFTNAVVLSVLAELPENGEGALMGLVDVYGSSKYPIFAYANGNGTFTLYYYDGSNKAKTSQSKTSKALDVTGLHVWTLAYVYNDGGYLYCDGELVASDPAIKWTNTHKPAECLTFGSAYTNAYPLVGMKIYAVHTDFGVGDAVRTSRRLDDSANQTMQSLGVLADFAGENAKNQVAAFNLYNETGNIDPKVTNNCVLRISEIMPKPTDDQDPGLREWMDVNGLESGWVEVENTSDQWVNLEDYKFIRSNRGKKTGQADFGNFPSRLVPPHCRTIFYTSERYSNSADMSVSAWATPDEGGVKPKIYSDLGNILVWPDKVNPKKSPFVRLTHTSSNTIVDTVIIPSDVPEGWSIIIGETVDGEATKRWLCPTPTRGEANTDTSALTKIGPNVGPLYELTTGKKHDSASEFARPVPPAQPGEDYEITFSLNPVMSPTEAGGFRDEDAITNIVLVYRIDLDDNTLASRPVSLLTDSNDTKDWGHTYKAYIPADALPAAGHLIQWKFLATDKSDNTWTSPSFNNKDDGYEWYGTIVEPDPETQMSATLPTWHMFASGNHLTQMDVDADKQDRAKVPNQARVAIYDSSTSNYYDYVRIDLRGHTSAGFAKKGHGLRFAKAHPLTMTDIVTGEQIKEIRKTSLISEFADPSYMRQMIAFWLWRKMGNKVPFDFPVRCNLNGEFYQLAFNSERFTDELIEDVYELDKYGYSYKNVGTLNLSTTTAGNIEKKTPDDEDEGNISVLTNSLINPLRTKNANVGHSEGESSVLTRFVVEKFNLPAWINYLASARITQEMDDVWANVCAYYDNAEMKEGVRGTDTWMPLGYDFNLSFGQYYIADLESGALKGLSATNDWYKSHPLYGGWTIRAHKKEGGDIMNGNNGFEAVYQSPKFRRLYLRRLRTLMDQELKVPGTLEGATPFMFEMRKLANLMRVDAAEDNRKWGNNTSDDAIDVWKNITRPASMDDGIDDIWENYVVPRRQHLYVTHSITNTSWAVGYAADRNAGIPEAQSSFEALAANITVDYSNLDHGVIVISNRNDEVVDMSGWTLKTGTEKKEAWTLPAGTVCDSNDCIYVVADRRKYISDHASELTDQVIVGNATFGTSIPEEPLTYPETETSSGTVSISEGPVVFSAANDDEAAAWVESLTPELTAEQKDDNLTTDYFTVVAEKVPGEIDKYKAVIVLNPEKEPELKPVIAEPTPEDDKPVEFEEDEGGNKTVKAAVSNAVIGLWYGYEVANTLGPGENFQNDVGSFERATEKTHTVTGSPRDKSETSAFFRVKVLPAKPSQP